MQSKAEMMAELIQWNLVESLNFVIAYNPEDAKCISVKDRLMYQMVMRIQRRYTMLEISDIIDWHPRKVGKNENL